MRGGANYEIQETELPSLPFIDRVSTTDVKGRGMFNNEVPNPSHHGLFSTLEKKS